MSNNIYSCTALTGGGAQALDSIDGANLADMDAAIVTTAVAVYHYNLDADKDEPESSPDIIAPNTNAGTKRWVLLYTSTVQVQQQLTDGANISWDMNDGGYGYVTLAGNRTLDNPTNVSIRGTYRLRITQDGTGSRTLDFGTNFKFPGDVSPTLSSGAGDVDLLEFIAHSSSILYLVNAVFDLQ